MKTTVSERTGGVVVGSGPGYGLGIAHNGMTSPSVAVGISCAAWGHTGEYPGYDITAVSSADGRHQALLMMNQDETTLPKPARELYGRLIDKAFCART